MNANLPPQTPTVKNWLIKATSKLHEVGIKSARLDAELILASSINESRTYLHAYADEIPDKQTVKIANAKLTKRLNHTPIAYIIGYKEFYGREFIVSPDVLVPRPESEDIINILKQILPPTTYHLPPTKLVDVGTGSGCLGITAKLEFPFLNVTLTDISEKALSVAKKNAKKHDVTVDILNTDLLQNYTGKPNIIIANLPYVDPDWERSPEIDFEPNSALFADDHGLTIIKRLIVQASDKLTPNDYLIIEADPAQHKELIEYAKKYHLIFSNKLNYIITFVQKVSDLRQDRRQPQ